MTGGQAWGVPVSPKEQVSAVVEASRSSQLAVLSVDTQPEAGLQESSVQTMPSTQVSGAPPAQTPKEQVSAVVQASRSSQLAVLSVNTQPRSGVQEWSGLVFRSRQVADDPTMMTPMERG